MLPSVPIAAGSMGRMSLFDSIWFIIVGFTLVMIALCLLFVCCQVLSVFFVRYEKKTRQSVEAARPPSAGSAPAAPVPAANNTHEEGRRLAAVIAAAVHVKLGSSARVLTINPAVSDEWAREGRRRHFASHKLR